MVKTTKPATGTESAPAAGTARVLVVVDARMRDSAALETAAALAARMRAEFEALLIEDESLSSLAGLPFTREIDRWSGAVRPWDEMRASRTLRVQQQMLSHIVTRLTESMQIATRVRVARGRYRREALAAAARADVTIFSRPSRAINQEGSEIAPGWPTPQGRYRARAGTTLRPAQPVWVLYDDTPASARALDVGVDLAAQQHAELRVLLLGVENGEFADRLRSRVEEQLSGRRVRVHFVQLTTASAEQMVEVIRRHGASFLCVARGTNLTEAESSDAALERLTCPVVVIG